MYQAAPHPSSSTGIKLEATYPAIRPASVGGLARRKAVPATKWGPTARVESLRQAGKVVAATLIVAILVIGAVELSLGLGSQTHRGVGPDHPPAPLVAPAPAPAPHLPAVSPRPQPAGE